MTIEEMKKAIEAFERDGKIYYESGDGREKGETDDPVWNFSKYTYKEVKKLQNIYVVMHKRSPRYSDYDCYYAYDTKQEAVCDTVGLKAEIKKFVEVKDE